MDKFMKVAYNEAKKAYKNEDIPVGAVIVKDGKIIAKGYNKKNLTKDPTMHAEIIAIKKACKIVGDFRLEDCDIYVTKEPCVMCYGAILSARINNVFFGAFDGKYSIEKLSASISFNHAVNLVGGIDEKECGALLSEFFSELRSKKCK